MPDDARSRRRTTLIQRYLLKCDRDGHRRRRPLSARLDTFGDDRHASLVRTFGTSLLTIRLDLTG